ncbi:TrkA family potassium uptake protein [Aminithiophilus ramosus]|uniref:TrkA family potassium uptake protein n=2 Tax=Synergistales TaxID=649776 RepID=A0A9Q7AFX5_9BACT|nr:TrkA family potassium uptake protein [Aminithiophilus ramosus]QTX32464.1 TrkA family potassium uptake protein [Aminithiophilus ramosus]QVL36341.1 TrkA family potassium uptake protein [Synergistota bacterium]
MASRYVVVAGCGRLGSMLAGELSSQGESLVVIDRDGRAFRRLPPEFSGFTLEGEMTEPELLRRAGTHEAHLFLATADDENANLFAAQAARTLFSVPRVVARVETPQKARLWSRLGIETVCPALDLAPAFLEKKR